MFFFGGIRLVADLFSFASDDLRVSMFINGAISKDANLRALLNENLAVVSLGFGQFLYYAKYGNKHIPLKATNDRIIKSKIAYVMLIVGFVVKAYTSATNLYMLIHYGYHEMFTGEWSFHVPLYVRAISWLPVYVILAKIKETKSRKWVYAFLAYMVLDLGTGQRGMAALNALTFFYILSKCKIISLNIFKVGIASVSAIIVFIFMSNFRNEQETKTEDIVISDFLWGQGTSLNVLQCAVQEKDHLDYHVVDMFGNVYSALSFLDPNYSRGKRNTLDQMLHYKVWSKYISYEMNSKLYWKGLGIGQCFAAGREPLVVFVNILIPFFLMFLDRKVLYGTNIQAFLAFNVLMTFLYIPRDNLFSFLTGSVAVLVAILMIKMIHIYLYGARNSKI
jgi:hypothetical protein